MKWGIIGYGRIAPKFATSLIAGGQEIVGIASQSNTENIQVDHPNTIAYSTYPDLLNNSEIEIVYIGTTHNFHLQNTLDALEAGKHVICEKPLGLSSMEVEQMVKKAADKKLFLLEAMWTRYLPAYIKMKKLILQGVIGDIKIIEANFGFNGYSNYKERLYNKSLAGGSVYDVGIYPIALFMDLFRGPPSKIEAHLERTDTGVEITCSANMTFGEAEGQANMISSIAFQTSHDACIYGTRGWIRLPSFWKCEKIELHIHGESTRVIELPFMSTGYYHEILEAVKCIENNELESSRMTHQNSLDIAEMIERILNTKL